jgi:two-component system, OmpR family, sensor histidine kinase VanS
MKRGIVFKLFILTVGLCTLILTTLFIAQTVFFKQFYVHKKVDDIKNDIQLFEENYINSNNDAQRIQKLEQEFYNKHSAWITTLDWLGNIKHTNDFYIEVTFDQFKDKKISMFSGQTMKIPLYSFINIEDLSIKEHARSFLQPGNFVTLSGITKDKSLIPIELVINNGKFKLENVQLTSRLYGNGQNKIKASQVQDKLVYQIKGENTKYQLTQANIPTNPIYKNDVLIERIKAFQAELLIGEKSMDNQALQEIEYEENDIKYKLLIKPIKDANGEETYIFAMASLQPVDEAIQMIKDYYIYLVIFALLLIFLVSFYYSKKIAKPLLQLNDTTKKIASLDFSERIQITSKDEIGDLSKNINTLSSTLHLHIHQLQQDIEKEKQLEKTRKEFIAGVSHELKTPLSIMKSCISIVKDGVASHKKDYYFAAMDKEVDKMDRLIVDMLELAKFESGTYQMEQHVFSIDEVIEHICAQLSLEIENKQLRIYKHLANVDVYANQDRIEQVVTNFITNAIRYTPEGEKIIISTLEEENMVKVCIENKGAQIPEEHVDKLWDRFYRTDASRQRSKGGTGLGLAISKNILELHQVKYGVFNTEDGVLFFFYLQKNV